MHPPTKTATDSIPTRFKENSGFDVSDRNVVETESAFITLVEPQVVHTKLKPLYITRTMSEDNLAAVHSLLGGASWVSIADVIDAKGAERAVRERNADGKQIAGLIALAVVTGNPVSRFLGNFFLTVSRPSYPMRLFANPLDALDWVRDHLQEHLDQ